MTRDRAFEGAIVDLDGTVYRGRRAIEGAVEGIVHLEANGVERVYLTNKAIHRRSVYRDLLHSFGVEVASEDVVHSAGIAAEYLAVEHPGEAVFVVGEEPLREELREARVRIATDPSEAGIVLASMDRSFSYDDLRDVLEAFESDPLFYATNPDRTCPVEDGEIPDAGAVIGAIEGLTGRSLDSVLGKPSPIALGVAAGRLGIAPENCLVVGDRLETDIRMATSAGMTSVLVLTGVTDRADVSRGSIEPDYVLDSLAEIDTVL